MSPKNENSLFNTIAPVYGLFYQHQKKHYRNIIKKHKKEFDISSFKTVLDVGCGTGALCSVLNEMKLSVTGIDQAAKMIRFAKRQPENSSISFVHVDALDGLPFPDNFFDVSIASYVAHGMHVNERMKMYAEMSRVTKKYVVIYDYNTNMSVLTSFVEWLEGGNYFDFIKNVTHEMEDCTHRAERCFSDIKILDVDKRASWYIYTPNKIR